MMAEPEVINADYLIAGAGCAGLSLAMNLKSSGLPFQRIILIDSSAKNTNDRTWCFWTKDQHAWYRPVIHRSWQNFEFRSPTASKTLDLQPYRYNLVRAGDFYKYCLDELAKDSRFEFRTESIKDLRSEGNLGYVVTEQRRYSAKMVFNSALRRPLLKPNHINYVQHFKGWVVETEANVFDPDLPMFMDFSFAKPSACEFYYIIPFSATKALVEFTGFSREVLSDDEYNLALQTYLEQKTKGAVYRIIEEEQGVIPMYESEFVNPFGSRVLNLGSAGGASKQSTGYTFYFIQKHVAEIVKQLSENRQPQALERHSRFKLYDSALMQVIDSGSVSPAEIFTDILTKNTITDTLAFLNEESSWKQDLAIMRSVKTLPFLKATLKKLWKV